MADILLKRDSSPAVTYVSNTFIDKYMTHADGEFVKIYLYLLRCINNPETPFSISDIADKFDHTEKDVKRALKYWEKMHLLRLEYNKGNELSGICLTDSTDNCNRTAVEKTLHDPPVSTDTDRSYTILSVEPPKVSVPAPEPARRAIVPTLLQTEHMDSRLSHFHSDENVQELLYVAERYLGHQLNHTETDTILYWMDKLGFSQDVIDYLIEQCVAKNHPSIQYMDKIALDWAEHGVHTLSEAKQAFTQHNHTIYAVKKAFGISNRNLADFEQNFVRNWSDDMGFSDEVIALACQKTLCRTQTINFKYANSILTDWQQQNAYTLPEIELLDAKHQKMQTKKYAAAKKAAVQASIKASVRTSQNALSNYNSFSQRTYDYEALERELLTR